MPTKLIALFGMLVATILVFAAPAAAISGGWVKHSTSSERNYLGVAKDWCGTKADPGPCNTPGNTAALPKGKNTYNYFGWTDTDGFYIPSGCFATSPNNAYFYGQGPMWKKIYDYSVWDVKIDCW